MSDNAKIEFTKMRLRRMTRERDDFRFRLFEEKITVKNLKMQMETLRDELNRLRRLTPTGTYTLTLAHEQEIRLLREQLDEERANVEMLKTHVETLREAWQGASEAVTKLGEQLNASEADCERFGKLLDDCRDELMGQHDPDSVNAMIHRIDDAIGPCDFSTQENPTL